MGEYSALNEISEQWYYLLCSPAMEVLVFPEVWKT